METAINSLNQILTNQEEIKIFLLTATTIIIMEMEILLYLLIPIKLLEVLIYLLMLIETKSEEMGMLL